MRKLLFLICGLASVTASAAISPAIVPADRLTATQIVDKNVAARGGLEAWRAIKTLTISGRMEAGGTKNTALPFVLKMERPRMSRLEIRFQNQTAVQVYDGEQGWKVRPFQGRNEVEPFTSDEVKAAAAWQELDGPLVDYAKKGNTVELQGTDTVEGHNAYKLKLTLKNGDERHVWIDAANFLELKIDGEPRKLDGKLRNVTIYYRNYKTENGLAVPREMETVVDGGKQPHTMYIEHVAVNQPIAGSLFGKPQIAAANTSDQ